MNDDNTQVTGPLSQMPGMNQNNSIDDYQPPKIEDEGLSTENGEIRGESNLAPTNNAPEPTYAPMDEPVVQPEPQVAPAAPVQPAEPIQMTPPASQTSTPPANEESLESQNIFEMLGVKDGSEEERESFLDELQEVIWEDFLDKDVELLITEEELKGLKDIENQNQEKPVEEQQEAMVAYLEKLIPDLEEIMLEKALELKEDLFRERISDMKDYYKDNQAALDSIAQAETAMSDDKWASAAKLLNEIK